MNRQLVVRRRRADARGQTLVEFALVFPIFMLLVIGIIEFAFVFNALLSIGHATRDAALIAAEAGNAASADCVILQTIEQDVSAPADLNRIQQVSIYRSNQNGAIIAENLYTRTGVMTPGPSATTCTLPNGSSLTVPYQATSTGYPFGSRCNVSAGCPDTATRPLDTIGVKIVYQHTWVTPLANLVSLGGSGVTLTQANAMRMEPVL